MEYLLNAREMKSCDENTSREFLVPSVVLMERAAEAFVAEFVTRVPRKATVLILVGTGNNGGDGLAIARLLYQAGYQVSVYLTGEPAKGSLCFDQLSICKKYQIPVADTLPQAAPDAVIDAIFGTGLSRNIEGTIANLLQTVNSWETFRAAVDIPSGISADHGRVLGAAFLADLTVTFAFQKLGLLLFPGASYSGEVVCRDIGITEESFLGKKPQVRTLTESDESLLPSRRPDTNKGDYGKILVIAGSVGMCGAAFLAAKAAYLSGAGLVRIFTPEENRIPLQQMLPEAIVTTYRNEKPDEKALIEAIHWASVVLLGPGLSTSETAKKLLRTTLDCVSVPLVIDADGLNLLAAETELLKRPHPDLVLTPHIGEMSRLTGDSVMYLKEERIDRAVEFANEYNVVLTLKDSRTVTAVPYGAVYLNLTGNNGMATGGSGDVLSGITAGMLATGLDAGKAAALAVYLHGRAGDLAAAKIGKRSLLASDLLSAYSEILKLAEEKETSDE